MQGRFWTILPSLFRWSCGPKCSGRDFAHFLSLFRWSCGPQVQGNCRRLNVYHFSGGVIMSLCYGCTNKSYNVANGQFYHQIYRGVMPIKSSHFFPGDRSRRVPKFSHFFYHFAPRGEWQNGVKRPTIPMGTGPSELSGDLFNYLPQVFNGPRVRKNRKKNRVFSNLSHFSMGNLVIYHWNYRGVMVTRTYNHIICSYLGGLSSLVAKSKSRALRFQVCLERDTILCRS